jgi:hypothetical protein
VIVAREGNALNRSERLWVAYPKGNRSDINRDTLWPIPRVVERHLPGRSHPELGEESAMRFRPLQPREVFEGGNNGGS